MSISTERGADKLSLSSSCSLLSGCKGVLKYVRSNSTIFFRDYFYWENLLSDYTVFCNWPGWLFCSCSDSKALCENNTDSKVKREYTDLWLPPNSYMCLELNGYLMWFIPLRKVDRLANRDFTWYIRLPSRKLLTSSGHCCIFIWAVWYFLITPCFSGLHSSTLYINKWLLGHLTVVGNKLIYL